jgi:hypothetical protein
MLRVPRNHGKSIAPRRTAIEKPPKLSRIDLYGQAAKWIAHANEKRGMVRDCLPACQLLAPPRRSRAKLARPAAFIGPAVIGDRPGFAASEVDSDRGPSESAIRHTRPAFGDRQPFVTGSDQRHFSAIGDRRVSRAKSDRQTLSIAGHRWAAAPGRRSAAAASERETFAASAHNRSFTATAGDSRPSSADDARQGLNKGSCQELAGACR